MKDRCCPLRAGPVGKCIQDCAWYDAARAQGWDGDSRATTIKRICNGDIWDCNGLVFRLLDDNNNVIQPIHKTQKRKSKIYGINVNDINDIVYYNSISEAAREEHLDRSSISKCINGSTRYSKVGGRIWRKVGED